ncbi:NtaA/DmoA family FMN-dependent monooxygenase [Kineococcus rhizosphaerae]|uniref:FMN-dependent oxidoreductase (Nitrilotriacetate monooxygenase family) n=1 Tax=Kineococcus rhizosphaerae TaxID=559628 RepID=A0A2T0R3P8_9ACTN|nr:NtaA/DmoA family FMN-dependent monooxygenase [Kineococcus rhizosphaerae]PRY14682.1 FMN-dependent oxidoreductase (nitrilotriacetate monooxygenase family) [Kineococcus rhizosphaerae]
MPQQIVLGAFEEFTPNFISNAWSHPLSDTAGFATLPYWQDMARQLEAGGFDFLFLAEAIGYPMKDDGSVPDAVLREAVQVPVHDPMTLVSGLAATVERLGFAVTASTTAQHPNLNARAFTSLDHLTDGRIAWNVVTSDNQQALTRLLGHTSITPHEQRYQRATEFLELSFKLWEGCWEDGAVLHDKATRTFADPARVHRVTHHGEHFDLDGYFTAIPSPQRTPFLLQAGTSPAGRAFAGRFAECVFIQDRDPAVQAANVADLRARAARHGRDPHDLKVVVSASVVVGSTEEEATRLRADLDATPSRESAAALFLGWSGVDLAGFGMDTTLADVQTEVGKSMLARFQDGNPTVGQILDRIATSITGMRITGTPESCADQIERTVTTTGLDGFLVEYTYGGMASYRGFIDHVVPILRRRGLLPAEPRTGSMRRRMLGHDSDRLPENHPGVAFRQW